MKRSRDFKFFCKYVNNWVYHEHYGYRVINFGFYGKPYFSNREKKTYIICAFIRWCTRIRHNNALLTFWPLVFPCHDSKIGVLRCKLKMDVDFWWILYILIRACTELGLLRFPLPITADMWDSPIHLTPDDEPSCALIKLRRTLNDNFWMG